MRDDGVRRCHVKRTILFPLRVDSAGFRWLRLNGVAMRPRLSTVTLARKWIVRATALCVAFSAREAAVAQETFVKVHGNVIDMHSGVGVAGQKVIFAEPGRFFETQTDGKGRFVSLGLNPGWMVGTIERIGFAPYSITCNVNPGGSAGFFFGCIPHQALIFFVSPTCSIDPPTVDSYVLR